MVQPPTDCIMYTNCWNDDVKLRKWDYFAFTSKLIPEFTCI